MILKTETRQCVFQKGQKLPWTETFWFLNFYWQTLCFTKESKLTEANICGHLSYLMMRHWARWVFPAISNHASFFVYYKANLESRRGNANMLLLKMCLKGKNKRTTWIQDCRNLWKFYLSEHTVICNTNKFPNHDGRLIINKWADDVI
jgi:hypothetical protein